MKTFWKTLLFGISSLCIVSDIYAEDITLYKNMLPNKFMSVNKKEQRCTLYGVKEQPITYACTTGQVEGDKEVEGDKKTPEGVYFITGSILEGLDFEEYGSRAYPLNYPNPIDTIEQKTGYGIWVHGKGKPFKERDTRGCVAFPEKDILVLYPNFILSYPVIIAENIIFKETEPSKDYKKVSESARLWANNWSEQVEAFFEHYDNVKKSNFQDFKKNKRYIFSLFDFTYTDIENPSVVRKGEYYTTWFRQYYYAPNMLIEGIRYLYWQMDKEGIPRIIAEEWIPDTSSETKERFKQYLAPKVEAFLAKWKDAWERANVKEYIALYAKQATQGALYGSNAIAKAKERNWKKNKPNQVIIENVRIDCTKRGIEVRFKQTYKAGHGYQDRGEKTLYIIPSSHSIDKWKITKESWKKTR